MSQSCVHFTHGHETQRGHFAKRFRTGVSLHSHTLHSKESLNFIYHASRKSALLREVLRHGEQRYRKIHGSELDLNRGWWTPPLAPLDAYRLEAAQIAELGLHPIVSLTDHDTIDAPMSLQAVESSWTVPVSVEWTVPHGPTFFHIGVHNLLPHYANAMMRRLADFTANPDEVTLVELFDEIHANPQTLIVFNHPLWDEKGVGDDVHRTAVLDLFARIGHYIHALEVNGLRPWRENRKVIRFAAEIDKPLISGGDRHAMEPNATINLTDAADFPEFAWEVRDSGWSQVLILPQYRQPHASRIFHSMLDVFGPYEGHGHGWVNWDDRVFFTLADGTVSSLAEIWGDAPPAAVGAFANLMQFAGQRWMRLALRSVAEPFSLGINPSI